MPINWLDNDYRQRQDINDTADVASAAENHAARLQRQVDGLVTMVMSLVELLDKNGTLNAEVWKAVVDERLSAPLATAAEKPPAPYVCTRCKNEVNPANTTMTANGVVCDACVR